jgi:hypothetical protein
MATPARAISVPIDLRRPSISPPTSQPRITAMGTWICSTRLAVVAGRSLRPTKIRAPWMVTASDEISSIRAQEVAMGA